MTERLRAVFDTNVFVSALLSHNPTSPTRELMRRWRNDEFVLLVSQAILEEVVKKLESMASRKSRFMNCSSPSAAWPSGWTLHPSSPTRGDGRP